MGRNVAGWALIVLGLAGIVGGIGMAYIFWIGNEAAARNARTQESMNPGSGPTPAPPSAPLLQYGSAALSAVAGLVLAFWGIGLRGSGPRKPGGKKRARNVC